MSFWTLPYNPYFIDPFSWKQIFTQRFFSSSKAQVTKEPANGKDQAVEKLELAISSQTGRRKWR